MTTAAIRHKLYDYIRVADDKKLHAIYNLLESDIEKAPEWWKDKALMAELEDRYQAMETGKEKVYTIEELEISINLHKRKKYGK